MKKSETSLESFTLFACIANKARYKEYGLGEVIIKLEYKTSHGYLILLFLLGKAF